MSRSRFVLKQIPVPGSGASDLTRYVARSKLDATREGQAARPLFTAREDNLAVTEARRWLSIAGDRWDKKEALHYVLSFASAREYELLGDDEDERRQAVTAFLRGALTKGGQALGLAEMRWVAGVHRNTDNPHLHLLLNRYGLRSDTGEIVRLARLPVPLIAHHTHAANGARSFSYGTLLDEFAAQVDARHRERTRFLRYEAPLQAVQFTRPLLPPETLQTRAPSVAERLVGEWLRHEIAAQSGKHDSPPQHSQSETTATARRPDSLLQTANLFALRAEVARLDRLSALLGLPQTPAFLTAQDLRDMLINPPAGAILTPLAHAAPISARDNQPLLEQELPLAHQTHAAQPLAPRNSPPILDPPIRPPIR